MAERSFKSEVAKLRLGAGEEFRGEGILAVTKALLQSGVSYVSGYQGAPISHLVDVLADADDVLHELGIRFEASANEAAAAAALAASINYPLRGAATFKSTVGTNVASDALANPVRDTNRIVLPPASYLHEREKIEKRWPAAVRFIEQHKLNEVFDGEAGDIGIVMQGGMYNTALRALEILGLADVFGKSRVPLYVLNVTYPLIDAELVRFCAGKKAILIIEEGQPEFIEQAMNTILRRADVATRVEGKSMLPMAGEYTGAVMKEGVRKFIAAYRGDLLADGGTSIASS